MSRGALPKLEVRLARADGSMLVGHLVEHRGRIGFEYAPSFLGEGRSLSPLNLPLEPGIVWAPSPERLHGLFDDALPDGWGMLLMDRHFRRVGVDPRGLSLLDRLAYLGERTMGALTFHPPLDADEDAEIDLDRLAAAADEVIEGSAADVLPALERAGGTPGGARPKVLVAIRDGVMRSGAGPPPEGFESWLIKFCGRRDDPDTGALEVAYARAAQAAGLRVPEVRLFGLADGRRLFGVRRFDRLGTRRAHVHTLSGLLNADFRVPNLDYDHLLRVTAHVTGSQVEIAEAFRRMVFNVLAGNRDDHGKNTALVMDEAWTWNLAPAYDLTWAAGPGGHHTMAVRGETLRPRWRDMLALAAPASIDARAAEELLRPIRSALARLPAEARALDVRPATVEALGDRLAALERDAELPGSSPRAPRRGRPVRRRAR